MTSQLIYLNTLQLIPSLHELRRELKNMFAMHLITICPRRHSINVNHYDYLFIFKVKEEKKWSNLDIKK